MKRQPAIWAIVPVKRFDHAKLRLAAVLDAAERAELARTMLDDVLSALGAVAELAGLAVVTADADAAALAVRFGAVVVDDALDAGINPALGAAIRFLPADGVLIVPADIPGVKPAEVRQVLTSHPDVTVVPALRDGGTNLLAITPAGLIAPCFGPDSFARHVEAARRAGVEPRVLHLASAGIDLDRLDDLAAYVCEPGSTRTHALLARFDIVARIERHRTAILASAPAGPALHG